MTSQPSFFFIQFALAFAAVTPVLPGTSGDRASERRPMEFMDVLSIRSIGQAIPSPDGQWLLYALSELNWKENKRTSDLYLVSLKDGLPSALRLTWTPEASETSPAWSRGNRLFGFLSDRATGSGKAVRQLYIMARDGGEARRISDDKDGVLSFQFSADGKTLAFSAGKEKEASLWILPVAELGKMQPRKLLKAEKPVLWWTFSRNGQHIFFLTPDSVDEAGKQRAEKKFDVSIRNEQSSPVHLWSVEIESGNERRLTASSEYSVSGVTLSHDGQWLGFRGTPNDRYRRTVTESSEYADLYLLNLATSDIEHLTNNQVGESTVHFSPSGTWAAFSSSNNFEYFRNEKIFVRKTSDRGGPWKILGQEFDYDISLGFWTDAEDEIVFSTGIGTTEQICVADIETGNVIQRTHGDAVYSVSRDEESGAILARATDAASPQDLFLIRSQRDIDSPRRWLRLTDANPEVRTFSLGTAETFRWKSTDGSTVEGVLVKPPGYRPDGHYPLVVQIHGGPASAVTLAFGGPFGYYSHVFAGAGYVCFLPNYRGSTNYGERFKMQIAGDYFRQGYEDIMAGVDELIRLGIADSTRMGVMGWSAGGHWSNWILTHTDRFKAISSGAGAVNWISMYAQTDMQRVREFYFGGQPYGRFEEFWRVSPLQFIRNACTPTLIHVVDGDPRVPRPQSEELHMALRQLGVPTEFLVYPGTTHGITSPRHQLVKMQSEFGWMEKWLKGSDQWLDWKEILNTVESQESDPKPGGVQ